MIPPPHDPSTLPPSVVRQGKNLSLLRQGFPLPTDRCYRCNAPAAAWKRKALVWHHPALYLVLLANLLVDTDLPISGHYKSGPLLYLSDRPEIRIMPP